MLKLYIRDIVTIKLQVPSQHQEQLKKKVPVRKHTKR